MTVRYTLWQYKIRRFLPVSCCCPSCLSSSIPLGESVSCSFSPALLQDFPSVSALSVLLDLLSFWPVFCSWIRTRDPLSVCQSWHKISRQILLQSSVMVSGSCFYLRQSVCCHGLWSAVRLSCYPSSSPDSLSVFLQPVPLCPAPVRLSGLVCLSSAHRIVWETFSACPGEELSICRCFRRFQSKIHAAGLPFSGSACLLCLVSCSFCSCPLILCRR